MAIDPEQLFQAVLDVIEWQRSDGSEEGKAAIKAAFDEKVKDKNKDGIDPPV